MGNKCIREDVLCNKYGRWTVIDDSLIIYNGYRKVLCKCSCPDQTEKMVILSKLKNGNSKSCGCLHKEKSSKRAKTHGLSGHHLYKKWQDMKKRCTNKNVVGYHNYGGRGISVCGKWAKDVVSFIEWALENGWEDGLEIDRINNDGNYEPSNCRFVTRPINILNRRLLQTNNTSGYCGVGYDKQNNYFFTKLKFKGKIILEKYGFKTAKGAAKYRDEFIIENDLPHNLNFSNPIYKEKD